MYFLKTLVTKHIYLEIYNFFNCALISSLAIGVDQLALGVVVNWINYKFGKKWISVNVPVLLPAGSANFTILVLSFGKFRANRI